MYIYVRYTNNFPHTAYSSADSLSYDDVVIQTIDDGRDEVAVCDRRIFDNKLDAIIYAEKNDINSVYLLHVERTTDEEFIDPDVIRISSLFDEPVRTIAGLDIAYQISGLSPDKSFLEAIEWFRTFYSDDLVLIEQLIDYDRNMKGLLIENKKQHQILRDFSFCNMTELIQFFKTHK